MPPAGSAADTSAKAPPLRIRHAGTADLVALVALENRVFEGDRLSARQWRHHLAGTRTMILVAGDAGDSPLGAAVVFFHAGNDIARLYSLAVAPEARGRGIGARLLAAVERDAARRGRRRMRLEVRRDNAAAQHLYRQHGFRLIGERRAYYEDGEDALRYEKALPGSRADRRG